MHPYYLVIQICVLWASQMILPVKILPSNAGDARGMGFDLWLGKIPWSRKWQPTPIFLSGDSHGQRNLVGFCLQGCKESDMNEHMCTHTHTHSVCYIMYTYMQYCLSVLQNEDNFHHTVLIRTILANKMSTTVSSCISLVRTI